MINSEQEDKMETAVYTHDEKGNRVDVHRPSAINPGDYEYVRVFESRKAPVTGGPGSTCHHCGKWIVWACKYNHLPSGHTVTFGYICAGILDLTDNRVDHEMVLLKRAAANERKKLQWSEQKIARNEQMKLDRPDLVDYLDTLDMEEEAGNFRGSDVIWMKSGYDKYGSLREWEIEKLDRIIQGRADYIARRLAEPVPSTPVAEGRYLIEGTVLKAETKFTNYGPREVMTVMTDTGHKLWGSVPASLTGVERNDKVSFEATVTKSDTDEYFGFYKKPTKGKKVN